ncbi:MAG: serine/threonine-protein kinase [Gemmataceae bacterium]
MVTAELGACEWFIYELRRSSLIDRGQLDQVVGEFLKKYPRADPQRLAEFLVQQNVLSAFQAERVLANKAQGLVLGPYVLIDAIGSGSMGTVFKALSKTDNKHYAVKVLPRRSMWNVRLARRQVRSFEQFTHPSVVPFVDVGTSGGMHYLVWPLVEGESLESLVQRQGKLSAEDTARIAVQVANGLAICHQNGLFHGLLKPSNVLVKPSLHTTILDFGIGSLLAENEGESLVDTMSTANTLTSGLDCSSPESIMEPTNRTPTGDQYSLGCTLYYCITGRYPFAEGTAVEKMMAHQFKEPVPVKELAPDTPDKLCQVIERLMKKSPDARYRGADEVGEELQSLAGDLPPATLLPPVAPPAGIRSRIKPTVAPSPMAAPPAFPSRPQPTGPAAVAQRPAPRMSDLPKPPLAPVSPPPEPPRRRSTPPAAPIAAYPQPTPYPAPREALSDAPAPSSYPAHGHYLPTSPAPSTSSSANLQLQMPTRDSLRNKGEPPQPAYAMPPGFIAPEETRPFSPLVYAAVGMSVMVVAYLVLMASNPFK